jgi:hypothetical protein
MAKHSAKKEAMKNRDRNQTAEGFGVMEPIDVDRWQRKDYGTTSIKNLLEKGSTMNGGSSINRKHDDDEEESIDNDGGAFGTVYKGSIKSNNLLRGSTH